MLFLAAIWVAFASPSSYASCPNDIWELQTPYTSITPSISAFQSTLPEPYLAAVNKNLSLFKYSSAILPPAPPSAAASKPDDFLPSLQNAFFYARLWAKYQSIRIGLTGRKKTPQELAWSVYDWLMRWPAITKGPAYQKLILDNQLILSMFEDLIHEIQPMQTNIEDFAKFTKSITQKFGLSEFAPSVQWRASANYVAMSLVSRHQGRVGLTLAQKEAMQSLALLHPLVDDYMDRNGGLASTLWMEDAMKGKSVTPSDNEQKAMLSLFHSVVKAYPPDKHPLFYSLFKEMYKAQVVAGKLQKPGTPLDQLVGASLYKGGICWTLAVYASLGKLSPEEFGYHFYGGSLLQLNDDLNDLADDVANGIETIFTREYKETGTIRAGMNLLFGMQKDFFQRYKETKFHRINYFATRFLLFMGFYSSNVAQQQLYANFGGRLNGNMWLTERFLKASYKLVEKLYGPNADFVQLMQYSFLGGNNPANPKKPAKITSP